MNEERQEGQGATASEDQGAGGSATQAATTIATGSNQRSATGTKGEAGGQTNGEQEVGEEASSVTGGHHTEEVIEVSSVSSSEADEQTTGPTIPAL